MSRDEQNKVIQEAFGKQAKGFANPRLTLNNSGYMEWVLERLALRNDQHVIDVAAGTGILSRAVAPHVDSVVSVDLSEAMLSEAKRLNAEAGARNIRLVREDVTALSARNATFDWAVSRFAFHHFSEPAAVLAEMVRVLKPGGRVAVIDLASPEDDALARRYNEIERLRDPSHTEALTASRFVHMFEGAGLRNVRQERLDVPASVEGWLALTETTPDIATRIRRELEAEISSNGTPTGMRPLYEDGELKFTHSWVVTVGEG